MMNRPCAIEKWKELWAVPFSLPVARSALAAIQRRKRTHSGALLARALYEKEFRKKVKRLADTRSENAVSGSH
jgi:hypothetical protein